MIDSEAKNQVENMPEVNVIELSANELSVFDTQLKQWIAKLEAGQLNIEGARRLLHGRGGCYPGWEWCSVDALYPILLVTCFAQPSEQTKAGISESFKQHLQGLGFSHCVFQYRHQARAPYDFVVGERIENSLAHYPLCSGENLSFNLSFRAQNTGYFIDIDPGRKWLESKAKGKNVLNLFAYTCAFSVVAVAAGARQVVNVDMSKSALSTGRENHRCNKQNTQLVQFLPLNILKSWSRIKKFAPYDCVIIDPPSFQKGSFVAQKDYQKLIRRLPELCAPGADVLACLNAPELGPEFILDCFAHHCPQADFVERLPLDDNFCDLEERRQLKLVSYRMNHSPQEFNAD